MIDDANAKLASKRTGQAAHRARNLDKVRQRKKLSQRKYVEANRDAITERARARKAAGKVYDRAAYDKKYRQEHREAHYAYMARYRLLYPEKISAYTARYNEEHREERKAKWKLYYLRNVEQIRERRRLVRVSERSVRQANHSPEMLMRAVYAAIPPTLPKFIRDEVAGEMMLAVLEGALLMDNIRRSVAEHLRRYNKGYETFKLLSLDAPIAGTDHLHGIDMLTSADSVFQFAR